MVIDHYIPNSILFIIDSLRFAKAILRPSYNLLSAATNRDGILKNSA